jgi:hypothetical protein
MNLTGKLKLKLYFHPASAPNGHAFVEVFHRWIQSSALPELMIDVADYEHVHDGPRTYFCGHESDYIIDHGEGRPGLVYVRKRVLNDESDRRLKDSLGRISRVAALLGDAIPDLRFEESELRVVALDRLNAPNNEATFTIAKNELTNVLGQAWQGMDVTHDSVSDPRAPLSLRVRGSKDASWRAWT